MIDDSTSDGSKLITIEQLREELCVAAHVLEELTLPKETLTAITFALALVLHLSAAAPGLLRLAAWDLFEEYKELKKESLS